MTEGHINIRLAVAADVAALASVFRRASWSNVEDRPLFAEHPEFLEWSGEPAREGRALLAEIDETVVGFVSMIPNGVESEVEDLFVDPDWMRRGVAQALIERVVQKARTAGIRRLVVDANFHALDFYRSAGFVPDHEVTLEHGTAMRMHLDVDAVAG